jgi:hypothetical protein
MSEGKDMTRADSPGESTRSASDGSPINRLRSVLGLDLPAGRLQPKLWRFILASAVAVFGSIAACAILAAIGTAVFPSTAGYEHFRFVDYARLTVIGVGMACLAWPATTWVTSQARRLYLWLAIAVTIVALAPDAWILYQGQSPEAVLVLVDAPRAGTHHLPGSRLHRPAEKARHSTVT